MLIKTEILGKQRELTGDPIEDVFFLNSPQDKNDTGIYCGCSLAKWNDEEYLFKIGARKEQKT